LYKQALRKGFSTGSLDKKYMNRKIIKINILICLIVFIGACNTPKIELPIDTPKEAIAIAKQDKEVQKFVKKWSQDFRIGFDAQYLSDKKVWLVRIFPKGNITDVELHVIIKKNGAIENKYPLI